MAYPATVPSSRHAKSISNSFFVLIGIWYILQVVGYWKIFQKAGKPGWHSIIPVLNVYDEFDICWKGFYGLLMMVALAVGSAFSNGGSEGGNTSVVAAVCGVLVLVLGIVGNYKLAKSFGKGIGTFLGLVFLEPLFMIILGFGSAEYQGKQLASYEKCHEKGRMNWISSALSSFQPEGLTGHCHLFLRSLAADM